MKKYFLVFASVFVLAGFIGHNYTVIKLQNEHKEVTTHNKAGAKIKPLSDVSNNNSKKEEKSKENNPIIETTDKLEEKEEHSNKELISSGTTKFNPNQIERSNNIRLSASYINGLILKSGEEFSFNDVVGERTKERGFLPADIILGDTVSKGYGGGVCQTSSTLCIAVKQTSMKIIEQNPHSQRVSYTTIENEAMINYGTSDFKFVNTYDFPITIEMSFEKTDDSEIIKCDIYGIK